MMRRIRQSTARDDGFTLVELLVYLLVMGVVMSAGYFVLESTQLQADVLEERIVLNADTQRLMDTMTRELRQARELIEGQGVFERAEPGWCTFYVDLDRDDIPERTEYQVIGRSLYKTVSTASRPVYPYDFVEGDRVMVIESLKDGWTGNVFDYYDKQDPPQEVPPESPEDVSAVQVTLTNSRHLRDRDVVVELSTFVNIRSVHNLLD